MTRDRIGRTWAGRVRAAAAAGAVALLAAGPLAPAAHAQRDRQREDNSFRWQGHLAEGSWIRVKNLNGSITVQRGPGDRVDVQASKTWKRGDPEDVRFEVVRDGDNVTICALWSERSSCDAESYSIRGLPRGNDVNVEITVRLPAGVRINAQTINGSVDVRGADSDVIAKTVNGRIDVAAAAGPVNASTINGGIGVKIDQPAGAEDLRFKTVNGSISVELPDGIDADIEMSTVNGSLRTDFPITINGRLNPRHLRASLGDGGRRIELGTTNGSIELKRATTPAPRDRAP